MQHIVNGKCLSIRQLSSKIKINYGRISELELSKREPIGSELNKYHKYFNVSIEYLLGETCIRDIPFSTPKSVLSNSDNLLDTIKWLAGTSRPEEKLLSQLSHMLFETNEGLLLIYYLSEYLFNLNLESFPNIFQEGLAEDEYKMVYMLKSEYVENEDFYNLINALQTVKYYNIDDYNFRELRNILENQSEKDFKKIFQKKKRTLKPYDN